MISINVRKSHFCLVSLLFHLIRSHKTLRDFKCSKEKTRREMDAANRVAQMGMARKLDFIKKKYQFVSRAIRTSVKSIKVAKKIKK